jgi:dTDP-4-amino-4,6-dideoxygalactose transaminase
MTKPKKRSNMIFKTKINNTFFFIVLSIVANHQFIQEGVTQNHKTKHFYPSLNTLPYVTYVKMEISEDIAQRVLCLPLYADLEIENLNNICNLLNA